MPIPPTNITRESLEQAKPSHLLTTVTHEGIQYTVSYKNSSGATKVGDLDADTIKNIENVVLKILNSLSIPERKRNIRIKTTGQVFTGGEKHRTQDIAADKLQAIIRQVSDVFVVTTVSIGDDVSCSSLDLDEKSEELEIRETEHMRGEVYRLSRKAVISEEDVEELKRIKEKVSHSVASHPDEITLENFPEQARVLLLSMMPTAY